MPVLQTLSELAGISMSKIFKMYLVVNNTIVLYPTNINETFKLSLAFNFKTTQIQAYPLHTDMLRLLLFFKINLWVLGKSSLHIL